MTAFQYTDSIIEKFPHVVGGVLIGEVTNQPTTQALKTIYETEQQAVKARLSDQPLNTLPSIQAWRAAFRQFGVDPTKYRSAAEALLRRLTKKGDIPSINTLVDIGNLVSIRYALPVAVFDINTLGPRGVLSVKLATGDETFMQIGADKPEHPEAGEVIFSHGTDVYARRWCWKQSQGSAANAGTTRVIVTIEAHHADSSSTIQQATGNLKLLLTEHANFSGSQGIVAEYSTVYGD